MAEHDDRRYYIL